MSATSAEQAIELALRHHRAGDLARAEAIYRQVLAAQPDHPDALSLLGAVAHQVGRHDDAVALMRRAIAARGDVATFHNNLGGVLMALGRMDDAIKCLQRAVELNSSLTESWRNLGDALLDRGRFDESVAAFERAHRLEPHRPDILNNLAHALYTTGRTAASIEHFRKAIEAHSQFAEAFTNLGNVLLETGDVAGAIEAHRSAATLKPDMLQARSNLLYAMHFDPSADARTVFQEHVATAQAHFEPLAAEIRSIAINRDSNRRIRVGYVSQDFRDHPVGRFMRPLLRAHDRAKFEVHVFSDVLIEDELTAAAKQNADAWHNIAGMRDADVAELVRRQRIDILVDLAGHTGVNRLLVFARKPAPVQVTYLGYPDTTGMAVMDYRITDDIADPPGVTEQFHTEQLVRLPNGFLCYAPDDLPDLAPPPSHSKGFIIFGSFNNLAKVSPAAAELWARILAANPIARLLIKAQALGEEATRDIVRARLIEQGIPADRLDVRGRTKSHREHLSAYGEVDIALDTFPYNGTTTTCEALAMGVPVVTLAGSMHAGRMGASLLARIGAAEWIAASPDDYVRIATELANDASKLIDRRTTLRDQLLRSPLGNARLITADLELAYLQMIAKVRSA